MSAIAATIPCSSSKCVSSKKTSPVLFKKQVQSFHRSYGFMKCCQPLRVSGVHASSTSGRISGQPEKDIEIPNASLQLTYLEGNSWQVELDEVRFLVDPIIGSPLDFNIPWLYSAYKYVTRNMTVDDLPPLDALLITQSLDDHCHKNTLIPLAAQLPNLKVISTPNAKPLLDELFKNVTYLEPGETTFITGSNGKVVSVKATAGPILGPPWQRPENGYILRSTESSSSLYLEPHCVFTDELAKDAPVKVVITPVVKQELPGFTLVYGQEDAVRVAKLLQAEYVVPMANAELDASGVLSLLVKPGGTTDSFQELLQRELPDSKFVVPTPNEALKI